MADFVIFGHSGVWIVIDVLLALVPIFVWVLGVRPLWNRVRWLSWILVYVWLLFLPNALYLGFEFKHLLRDDGVAEVINLGSVGLFVWISILGWSLTVWAVSMAVSDIFKRKWSRIGAIVVLSYMTVWGVVLGDLRLHTIEGLLHPGLLWSYSVRAMDDEGVMLFSLVTGAILAGWVWWWMYVQETWRK